MAGIEYPKIQTLYNRDQDSYFVLVDQLRRPEFANIKIWSLTEKIHGRNTRVTLFDSGIVDYGGRTDDSEMTPELLEYLKKTFPPEKLKEVFWLPGKKKPEHATMYGEAYGADMAHGSKIYRKDISFRLFDCLIDIYWLERSNLEDIARKLGIKCVPLLGKIDFLPTKISQIEKIFADNKKSLVISEESDREYVGARPEGIVARCDPMLYFRDGGKIERLMWKLKIKDFEVKVPVSLKWKWQVVEDKTEWTLVTKDDEKVIATIVSTKDENNSKPEIDRFKVVAESDVLKYKEIQEGVYKKDLKIMISNMKNFMQKEFENYQK